jgi:hypothetical protein
MMTTRISHTGHNHPSTTAARTACRKAMKAAPVETLEIATVGNGSRFHYIDKAVGTTRCGKVQPVFVRMGSIDAVDCKGCRSKYGQAHG